MEKKEGSTFDHWCIQSKQKMCTQTGRLPFTAFTASKQIPHISCGCVALSLASINQVNNCRMTISRSAKGV
jgi:hypothetical protein